MSDVGLLDFHSHLLPGVDDGSRTVAQSIESLAAFAAQGFSTCITTPHFDASLTRTPARLEARLAEFDAAWQSLREGMKDQVGLPTLARGTEVMLDEPNPDLSDPRIRLAGGTFILCEFPALRLPPNARWAIENLVASGWRPIVAHPERYRNLDESLRALGSLREAGASFQVNAGSLLGQHGVAPERVARELLRRGWAEFLASDHHARGVPATARAIHTLREAGGAAQAAQLTMDNPRRLLAGEPPLPVAPLEPAVQQSWWQRLLRR